MMATSWKTMRVGETVAHMHHFLSDVNAKLREDLMPEPVE